MVYRPEYIESVRAKVERKRPAFDAFIGTQRAHMELMIEVIPGYKDFFHKLLWLGDLEGAVQTGVIQRLKREGYFLTEKKLLTPGGFAKQYRPWTMRFITEGVLNVAEPSREAKTAEAWHQVELSYEVKKTPDPNLFLIDTEFFSPNVLIGGRQNVYDDLEKFHIIWQVDRRSPAGERELIYMGFGANEPHHLKHARNKETGIGGQSRFYIYDPQNGRFLEYQTNHVDLGPFDWNWQVRPIVTGTGTWEVSYVQMPDGSRLFSTDPVIVESSKSITLNEIYLRWCAAKGFEAPPPLDEASEQFKTNVLSKFRMFRLRLTEVVGQKPAATPTIPDIAAKAGADYSAYFAAILAPVVRPSNPKELLEVLKDQVKFRFANYEGLLNTDCSAVFTDKYLTHLPRQMRDVWQENPAGAPPELTEALDKWRQQLLSEMRLDLYHYGQNPYERVHVLRLGILLASDQRFGGIYWKILEQAEVAARGGQCSGEFDITLPGEAK